MICANKEHTGEQRALEAGFVCAARTGRDEAEAAGGHLMNLKAGNAGSVAGNTGASSSESCTHPLLGEVLRGVLPTREQKVSKANKMANGGWRKSAHPRELARKLVSCAKGGTALFSKSGVRRKPSQIVPTDATLRSIKRAKAKQSAKWASITHGIVYKLTSPSGKAYVGISKHSLEFRMRLHLRSNSYCKAIKAALNKYGEDAFTKELLHEHVPLAELGKLEVVEIARHGTYAPGGYNLTEGGEINPMDRPESRAKVSKSKTQFWAGKTKEEKGKILSATQDVEVRRRATETNRKGALERAQARADARARRRACESGASSVRVLLV